MVLLLMDTEPVFELYPDFDAVKVYVPSAILANFTYPALPVVPDLPAPDTVAPERSASVSASLTYTVIVPVVTSASFG